MENDRTRQRCEALLISMLGREDLAIRWWHTPNKFFKGETPEKIYSDSPTRVYEYLISCAEGEW